MPVFKSAMGADGVFTVRHMREWIPRKPRHIVDVAAVVHRSNESKVAARLFNMSFSGCGLAAACALQTGERVRIAIPGQGYIEAEMRWSSDNRGGARFLCESPV